MANNNFYLNSDPLLFGNNSFQTTEDNMKKQLNDAMLQYKMLQQQMSPQKDYVADLDNIVKGINNESFLLLNNNAEYQKLNTDLQSLIQDELMKTIKGKINSNPEAIKNIERQIELINEAKNHVDDEQRRNLSELNDYVKNYSNITFDEYKKLKNKELNGYEDGRTEEKTTKCGRKSN